ncbi:MAG: ATP-binding cassette domain-containing protein [Desulfovibrio sp.]|jgi:ABC-type branched-subunit amino acid transport system ATPase component|nr:ATP-binding cassette domain-containing protein [Desulfovibrio sp.]
MNPLLICTGLTMRFGGLTALDNLYLEAREGEVLGLVGPNGSGKTTLFNVLTGIYRPSAGKITFAGENITSGTPQEIHRRGIARTFQRSRLCLDLSVFDNIMIGNHTALRLDFFHNILRRRAFCRDYELWRDKAAEMLRALNPSLVSRMFRPVGDLSMIDRRRVENSRALVRRPRHPRLHDPSAGMTHDETRQLMDEITASRMGGDRLTVILIEHEMEVIRRSTSHCVVLNFGRKLCEGDYAGVVADPRVQEAYLGKELE